MNYQTYLYNRRRQGGDVACAAVRACNRPGAQLSVFWIAGIALLVVLFLITAAASPLYARKNEAGKLGPFLQRLVEEYERTGKEQAIKLASESGIGVKPERGEALIPVILEAPRPLGSQSIDISRIEGLGLEIDAMSQSFIRLYAPVSKLRALGSLPDIRIARVPIKAKVLDGYGTIVSQSVALTGAGAMQGMGFDGSGVKIAIVDLGFIGLTEAIAAGEIPPTAHRLKGNQTGIDIEVGTPHGTGVAEHAIDMAPGAELYCIYIEDEVDLENAAGYMRDNGIQVANHSVGWVNASYYDDTGPLTGIINNSYDSDGVFWAVSAGNDANRHWRGTWSDKDGDSRLNWTGGPDEYHDLSGSYSTAYIFLNWDQYGNSLTDLDLYVYDKSNNLVASGTGSQTGPEDPQEWVGFSYDTGLAPYRVVVEHYSGPTDDLDMTIFSFYHDLEYAIPGNALMEPADAHGAFTVGAIYQGNYNLPDPPPEPFSSHGPTNDGRMKPDITAPDGTQSYTYGASYGTSFSSPTTAGAAAVMLSLDPTFTPTQIGDSLMAMAVDIGIAGQDSVHGAGKLNFAVSIDSLPVIDLVTDVPDDQGLAVEIGWQKSYFDYSGSPREIVAYDILRQSAPDTWDSVQTVPATGAGSYQAIAPTVQDSTVEGGIYYSVFTVRARTAVPGEFFISEPDSGYSVDNIIPPVPTGFVVDYTDPGGNLLTWDRSDEPDVVLYRIYRDIEISFDPLPEDLVYETPDTFWVDPIENGHIYYYRVSAVDDAGNESDPGAPDVISDGETGDTPRAVTLHQNVPNPFNPTTSIRFDLPAASRVRLTIFDVNGRLVSTLADEDMQAGTKEVTWNGLDNEGRKAASGVYFYRLSTPGQITSRKMILLR